jgi:hypothetical protein
MSEQALKYRSFSGGRFASFSFLCLSVKVIVSVAILSIVPECVVSMAYLECSDVFREAVVGFASKLLF